MDQEIDVLPWSPCSPGLNPIDNVLVLLVRAAYHNFRQFDYLDDLPEAITYE